MNRDTWEGKTKQMPSTERAFCNETFWSLQLLKIGADETGPWKILKSMPFQILNVVCLDVS